MSGKQSPVPQGKTYFIAVLVTLVILLTIAGNFYYRNEIASVRKEKSNELKSIAEIKIRQISDWYADELNDAGIISENILLYSALRDSGSLSDPAKQTKLKTILNNLKSEHGYTEVLLASAEGKVLVSTNEGTPDPGLALVDCIRNSVLEKRVLNTDLYLDSGNHQPRMDFVTPLQYNPEDNTIALVLCIDPDKHIYSVLSFWPTHGESAETVLVRRDGDSILFLNELRFQPEMALKYKISRMNGDIPAIKAIDGYTGFFDGKDYRNVEVMAYISRIPGTPWALVNKVDKSELFAGFKRDMISIFLIFILLTLFVGAVFFYLYSDRKRQVEKSLIQSREEFRTTIYSIGDAVIITDNAGKVRNLNPVAEQLTGWAEKDAINRDIEKVFMIINENTRLKVKSPVKMVLEDGVIVGLANHSLLVSKDGREIPVADSGAPIKDDAGNISGVVLVFRDQTEEHARQAAIIENEEKYRRMFEANPQPMWIYDVETLAFLEVNDAAISHYGYSRDEFLAMTIRDIRPEEDIQALLSDVAATTESYNPAGVWRHLKRNGELIFVEIVSHQVVFNNTIARHVLVNDITDRSKAEELLRKSEQKFRNLFENHAAVKLIIDPENGAIADANEAAAEFYGWSRDELTGMTIFQINTLGPEYLLQVIESVKNRSGIHFDFRHRLKNGNECDVEVYSSTIDISGKEYLHSIVHDVTEKKKAEQQVSLLFKSIEQSPVTIMITDSEGKIEYVNPKFSQITGYPVIDSIGRNPRFLQSGKTPPEKYQDMWSVILSGKEWQGEFYNRKKNGEFFWEYAYISPVFNSKGELVHIVAVKEDISDKKKMLEELLAAKEKAVESDRLKSAFLANMSHEIRTPMNGILGFMDLLQESDLSGDQRAEYIEIVRSSGNRLLSTINDIINISKIESGQSTVTNSVTDINSLLKHLYNFFRPEAEEKGLVFSIVDLLPPRHAIMNTDSTKLESILTNLIKNALKFTTSGSISFGCKMKGDMPGFYVMDTGIGIPENKLNAVFERFIQADSSYTRPYEGSGLGLSIAKAYVEMLGGSIHAESEYGKGTAFYFDIACKPVVSQIDQQPEFTGQMQEFPGAVILVAEDDEISYTYLRKVLGGGELKLIRAFNGEEAVSLCREVSEIALVLMDIKMPLLDGYEATKQIMTFRPNLPVIATTAYAFAEDRKIALASGCVDYLSKPLSKEKLFGVIKKHLHSVK